MKNWKVGLPVIIVLAVFMSLASFFIFRTDLEEPGETLCAGAQVDIKASSIVSESRAGFPFSKSTGILYNCALPLKSDLNVRLIFTSWQFYFNAVAYGSIALLVILGIRKYANTRH